MTRPPWRRFLGRPPLRRTVLASTCAAAALLAGTTWFAMREFPADLRSLDGTAVKSQILARDGTPLSFTLANDWNTTDLIPLADMPDMLKSAFIAAEDQHFYEHHGVDWPARFAALWLDLRHGAAVRGASSITEQVVRMIHPRPRNLWSRWIEGFEAARLDARLPKDEILSFYLNQVPYIERRRGVLQAAHYYFNRGLDTLSPGEMLALAVLVRSPAGMDLRHNAPRAHRALDQLADRMRQRGELSSQQREQIRSVPWRIDNSTAALEASHFVVHALTLTHELHVSPQVRTTLDPHVQLMAQRILERQLGELAKRHVRDAAILVIDHRRNEILAWVVGQAALHKAAVGTAVAPPSADVVLGFDTVLTPRQPGSTMKPLLYALALERGWTAATMIDDAELSESVGGGQHTFQNYSRRHYGPLRLREALGNSLNIPAVKALKFVGEEAFLARLHRMGITSLTQHPEFYGDGLALGNGEISLYEMAQAYTVLAREGRYKPLTLLAADSTVETDARIFDPGVATLVGNILADPDARMREFGRGLQFPIETAIKTGTSTDYRDAWAIAFDYRHTVAVWMGNLDGSAMDGVTGAVGPAMVLRSVFSELNRDQDTHPLPLSPGLIAARICRRDGRLAHDACESTDEWFLPATLPPIEHVATVDPAPLFHLLQPTAGLQVAHDPRIPRQFEALPMQVASVPDLQRVDWYIDGKLAARTADVRYSWPLQPGTHDLRATIWTDVAHDTEDIRFHVH